MGGGEEVRPSSSVVPCAAAVVLIFRFHFRSYYFHLHTSASFVPVICLICSYFQNHFLLLFLIHVGAAPVRTKFLICKTTQLPGKAILYLKSVIA